MTSAAIDRVVHATIVEMNVGSYRRRTTLNCERIRGGFFAHDTKR